MKEEKSDNFSEGKIWDGIYKNFAEANDHQIDIRTEVWDNSIWMKKQLSQQNESIHKLNTGKIISELAVTKEYCLPLILSTMYEKFSEIRVLDFGGGLGSTYLPLISMLPEDFNFKFTIVENEALCESGNELFKDDKKIQFSAHMPLNEKFDIVHLGSSMQYVENWQELINDFYKMKPRYLIFADLPAGDIETFVTNQNFNGTKIPVRFWNVAEFISETEKFGFKLLMKSRYHSNYLSAMKFFPEKYQLNYFSQLIFGLN